MVIHVAGALGASGAPLLRDLVESARTRVVIDLAELVSVDRVGMGELLHANECGVEIRNATPYVAMQFDEQRPGTSVG